MTERAKHWRALLREQERSGLTQAAFCRERKVSSGTFAWWKRRLRADAGAELAGNGARSRRGTSRTDPFRIVEKASGNGRKNGHGRRPLPPDLPRDRIELPPAEADLTCAHCGQAKVKISEKITEVLDYVPASFVVRQYVRPEYMCKRPGSATGLFWSKLSGTLRRSQETSAKSRSGVHGRNRFSP